MTDMDTAHSVKHGPLMTDEELHDIRCQLNDAWGDADKSRRLAWRLVYALIAEQRHRDGCASPVNTDANDRR